ncbi:flavin reductase (NADPH) isoform X3 [Frankliniella occidentalis]|uniref:Flavin reductase (NADPH) isoform X3 n=1 Tax=Frankliniella occidentalis TaxID=133901 RepID=A0A9C6XCM9_FRAOC|nr:flavin reductase (NADPH) isoform X3 [Frankliniella occidentalis]
MKKIAIFGGTGNTGLCAVDAALKKGLVVRALARDPAKFPVEVQSKVEIVQGDVLNYDDVKKTVEGVDAAVIVLGTRNDVKPTTMMSEGTKNILNALKEAGVKPVSGCMSSEPSGNYEIKHGSSPGRAISKYDLGFFLVDCLDKPEHYHQMVGIAKPLQA